MVKSLSDPGPIMVWLCQSLNNSCLRYLTGRSESLSNRCLGYSLNTNSLKLFNGLAPLICLRVMKSYKQEWPSNCWAVTPGMSLSYIYFFSFDLGQHFQRPINLVLLFYRQYTDLNPTSLYYCTGPSLCYIFVFHYSSCCIY